MFFLRNIPRGSVQFYIELWKANPNLNPYEQNKYSPNLFSLFEIIMFSQ